MVTTKKETVYVCDTKKTRDLLDEGIYFDPVKNALQDFPQFNDSFPFRIPRPIEGAEDKWNVILRVRINSIDQLVYPFFQDTEDSPWQGLPFRRDRHEELIKDYLHGHLRIRHEDGKIYSVNVEGPKIIIVDSRRRNKRDHPNAKQYAKIVSCLGCRPLIFREDGLIIDPGRVPWDERPEYQRELFAMSVAYRLAAKKH